MRGGGLQRGERNAIAVAQVMMAADGHAIAQSAKAQRRFQVGHALVAVCGIVACCCGLAEHRHLSCRVGPIAPVDARRNGNLLACHVDTASVGTRSRA